MARIPLLLSFFHRWGNWDTEKLGRVSMLVQLVVKIGSVKTVCEAAGLKSPSFSPSYHPASDVTDLRWLDLESLGL